MKVVSLGTLWASDGHTVLYAAGLEVFIGQVQGLIPGYNLFFKVFQIFLELA